MTNSPLPAPLLRPGTGRWPVLLSVPHAGTDYPDWLLRNARRGRTSLEPLEDPLVDRLVWRAAALGIAVVVARTPRAVIDCNRGLREIDPAGSPTPPDSDPGPRARGGLGLVPTRTPRDGELWRQRLTAADLEQRLAQAWRPFHALVGRQLDDLQRRHGEVVLLDVHSMPARAASHPPLVIGDRFGQSAGRWLGDLARRTAEADNFSVAFNEPYAGGYVVEHHGRPRNGVHALQLELDRRAYLAEDMRRPGPGFDRTARMLEQLARSLGEALLERNAHPEAAE